MYEDIFVSPTEDNQVEFIAGDKSFGYYDSYIVYLSKSVAIQFAKDLEVLKGSDIKGSDLVVKGKAAPDEGEEIHVTHDGNKYIFHFLHWDELYEEELNDEEFNKFMEDLTKSINKL